MKRSTSYTLLDFSKLNSLNILSEFEQKQIIGGDPSPAQVAALLSLLSNIFVQNSNCDPTHWDDFNAQVALLATTNVGFDLLTQIVSSAAGRHIHVSGTDPFPSTPNGDAAEYKYFQNGGNILLGNLKFDPNRNPSAPNYTEQDASHFGTIAHELFHAFSFYTNNEATYGSSVRKEMDALLFEIMACAEIDLSKNLTTSSTDLNKSYMWYDVRDIYGASTGHPSESLAFQIAFYDIFHNKNFTVWNYNYLLVNLIGSKLGSGYSGSRIPIDETTFNASAIQNFFEFDYSQTSYFGNYPPFPFNEPNPYGALFGNGQLNGDVYTDSFGLQWYVYNSAAYVTNGVFNFEAWWADVMNLATAAVSTNNAGPAYDATESDPITTSTGNNFWGSLFWSNWINTNVTSGGGPEWWDPVHMGSYYT